MKLPTGKQTGGQTDRQRNKRRVKHITSLAEVTSATDDGMEML